MSESGSRLELIDAAEELRVLAREHELATDRLAGERDAERARADDAERALETERTESAAAAERHETEIGALRERVAERDVARARTDSGGSAWDRSRGRGESAQRLRPSGRLCGLFELVRPMDARNDPLACPACRGALSRAIASAAKSFPTRRPWMIAH